MSIYREHILDHYKNPRNRSKLSDFTHYSGKVNNPLCGDEVEVWIRISNIKYQISNINDVSFNGHGCAICIASASMLTEWVKGKTIQQIEQVTAEIMMELLGIPLAPVRLKCALLIRDALYQALRHGEI
ncbi:MAG TPA: iron-sulfur cluster assembly scaffold protein [Patescibacteria group bacterium]|nr:iron-sulfur cluster assembly scaffold protein [Patescibacteria group bacterium]